MKTIPGRIYILPAWIKLVNNNNNNKKSNKKDHDLIINVIFINDYFRMLTVLG